MTNRGATTWYELACEIVRLAGLKVAVEAITTAEYPHAAPRPAYSVLDTSAYHRLGGPGNARLESGHRRIFRGTEDATIRTRRSAGVRS